MQIVIARIRRSGSSRCRQWQLSPLARRVKTSATERMLISIDAFRSAVGKERRVDLIRAAAELVGHQRRDVIDVGIMLALNAARGRNNSRHRTRAVPCSPATTALTPLPPVMQIVSPSAISSSKQPRRGFAHSLKRRLRIVRNRWHDNSAVDARQAPAVAPPDRSVARPAT